MRRKRKTSPRECTACGGTGMSDGEGYTHNNPELWSPRGTDCLACAGSGIRMARSRRDRLLNEDLPPETEEETACR